MRIELERKNKQMFIRIVISRCENTKFFILIGGMKGEDNKNETKDFHSIVVIVISIVWMC